MVVSFIDDLDASMNYADYRAQALAEIRRESLDIFNRVHSIAEDVEFVRLVAKTYPDLPILRTQSLSALHNVLEINESRLDP